MKIREFRKEDAEQVSELVIENLRKINKENYSKEVIEYLCEVNDPREIKKKSKDRIMLVAETEGKIVGIISLDGNKIRKTFVDTNYQGRGVGSELLKKLEEIAKQKGIRKLITDSSFTGKRLYEKNGFENKGKKKIKENNIEYTAIRMEKVL